MLLVEQYRVPLGARCLELPAGLVGDEDDGETRRGGRERASWRRKPAIAPRGSRRSAGSTPRPAWSSEGFTLVRATGLTRVGEGGGVGDEDIAVHRVPLADVAAFVAGEARRGRGDRRQAAAAARAGVARLKRMGVE